MLAPASRPAIYVGKLLGIVLLLLASSRRCSCRSSACCSTRRSAASPLLLVALLGGGTIGFAAVGTLFAAMLVRARSRDVLLPILLYPITIPVIIAGVRGTAALLRAGAGRGDWPRCGWRCWRSSTSCS